MKITLAIALLSVALMAPGMASATTLTGLDAMGNCEAWALEASVHWGWSTLQANLDYVVTLTDLDGNVLEEVVYAGVLTRPQGSPVNQVYEFSGNWEGTHYAPGFIMTGFVHLVGPNNDTTLEFSETLDCTVASEDVSWGTLKAYYH